MVNKTIGYETAASPQPWQRSVLFATDDLTHGGGNFYDYSDTIADGYADPPANTKKLLPPEYTRTKVYMGQSCPQENPSVACRKQVIDAINAGTLLTSYIGHGTKTYWAPEYMMDITALGQLTNSDKLTIMLPMTCDNGYFAEPKTTDQSFSEAVRAHGGGWRCGQLVADGVWPGIRARPPGARAFPGALPSEYQLAWALPRHRVSSTWWPRRLLANTVI